VLLPLTDRDVLRLDAGREWNVPVRIYNPRGNTMRNLTVRLSSDYPTVNVTGASANIAELPSGSAADVSQQFRIRLTASDGFFAPASLNLSVACDGCQPVRHAVPVLIAPEHTEAPVAVQVLDGRTVTFNVFRQKGNSGGGASVQRTVTEGRGNGNGVLEPGEEATIWVQMRQGMDPFDKGNWYRVKLRDNTGVLEEVADIEEQKQLEWTSAKERTSVVRLTPRAAKAGSPAVLLENESWSYHFTPDVRYGKERLYQAFQLHSRHLHRIDLKVLTTPRPSRPR
jgi:hypothetical protein